jgi:hypothetical protein
MHEALNSLLGRKSRREERQEGRRNRTYKRDILLLKVI